MPALGRRSLFALLPAAPLAVAAGIGSAAAKPLPGEWRVKSVRRVSQRIALPEIKPIEPRFDTLNEAHWDKIAAEVSNEIAAEIARMEPSARDLAATLGIPHDEPRAWTNEEVALTLGIDVQRDGIVIGAATVRT